ncbi:TPA: type IV pili twitching motility protein PilT [Patescibacteria group bacterium]|nr:MAG: Pili biogenesis protein ATPase [Parcubacteria group bacterium GW2011_GWD2_42_14]HCC05072.1 type IV pili twitching motility protein PilT [Patescibacteria group bacterium]
MTNKADLEAHKKTLDEFAGIVVDEQASDLHINAFYKPVIRVSGSLLPLTDFKELTHEDSAEFLALMLNEEQRESFDTTKEIDFSYYNETHKVRFRGNACIQRGAVSIALRLIPTKIETIADLNLPVELLRFTERRQGFFLVVGPVGQGKSTTLAALIEYINQTRAAHIVTIEDPIEFIYTPKQCLIDQREVHLDTDTFESGLYSAFRQDMDVILVGEMRGNEAIGAAVTAAETGHLVFSTLHTNNASQTIDRIVDSFPSHQQDQIRIQLASSLSGIFSMRLVPKIAGGLVPAYELLVNTRAISNMIRERRTHEIDTMIETGSEDGMISMNNSLTRLVRAGEISVESALAASFDPQGLERLL